MAPLPVKELFKIVGLLKGWPWPRVCYGLTVFLLLRHEIHFAEAVALILLPVTLGNIIGGGLFIGAIYAFMYSSPNPLSSV